ncbi:MAG: response regulator [Massilia sp.]|nr:response regulator [Massilia sp.]
MQEYANLTVLVIDPNPVMRASLQNMLNVSNISKIDFAVSSGTAIKALARRSYDLILCEYDLGSGLDDGQDGQQLLEDLRHHKLIGLPSIFIMITSEGVYSKVVSAAELTPTDYILKPFTVDALIRRIARAIDKRAAFHPAFQLIGQGNPRDAIKACMQGEAAHPRYALDFVRLRAELHASLDQQAEAEALYGEVLAAKPVGWAGLGLARTLAAQERFDEAEALLSGLVADHPKLMAAYDLRARCFETTGAPKLAQRALEDAVAISPHMVRRLRKLGDVAFDAGDLAVAEKSFRQVVAKARYSEFRDPEDHVNLVKALVKKGDPAQAGTIIRDLEKSLRGNPNTEACTALSKAMLFEAAGNFDAVMKELNAAVLAVRGGAGLSGNLKLGLARSCLANKLDREASEVMLSLMNDIGSGVTAQQVMSVFVKAGRPDLADGIRQQVKAQAQGLLGAAAEKSSAGDFRGAVQTLLEARHLSPGNLPVMIAAAGAILRQIDETGWDHGIAEQCAGMIDTIRKLDAAHPELVRLNDGYLAAKRKYGISA